MKKAAYLILLVLFPVALFSAETGIRFGPRPPIDLASVPSEAYENDRFRIRLNPLSIGPFGDLPGPGQFGVSVFNIQAVDQLAAAVNVTKIAPTFSSPALAEQYSSRHQAWGLHLWFDLHVSPEQDITSVIQMFFDLEEVDVAEPVYLKQLVSGEVFEWDEDAFLIPAKDNGEGWFPNDSQFDNQWHYHNTGQTGGTPGADIRMPQAWDIEKGDSTILVAIIDDGIQFDHPDLEANMWDGIGYNFVNNSPNVVPGNHGTHVAGTVAAVSNNEGGVAGVAGGSGAGDGVRLMSAQVFQGSNSGGFANAMIWAADNDAAISQNSWGYTSPGVFEQVVLDAIDYFNANGGGDVLDGGITIFAAGNSNSSGQWYPGFYEGAMSVAATNHNDQRAAYSTYGEWVDLSAPGGETTVANNRGVLSTVTGSNYAFYQGTSMACPHVSGVAALVLSKAPGQFTNMELWDLLVTTTDNHYGVNPGFIGQLGSGRLNALNALLEVDNYLIGLINPTEFVADATGTEEVELSWTPNADQDPVLLAYSDEMFFGTPEGDYEPGDTIEGGGTVLYAGAESTFTHSGLESATSYFYRIWSRKDDLYSTGRMQMATTWCDLFVLPFEEDFENPEVPVCWETIAGSGGNWQVGSFPEGLNIDGNYAYSGSGLNFGGQNASLVSPIIDMTQFEDVTISFKHYFRGAFLGGSSGVFSYSLDNGSSWVNVESWSSTTANPETYEVTIPELDGEPMVRFRWNFSSGLLGYYWTMGELSVTGNALEAPEIFIDEDEIVIELESGETEEMSLSLSNQGDAILEVTDIFAEYQQETSDFIEISPTSLSLVPGDEENIHFLFDATSLNEGSYSASIHILSNDPFQPEIEIPVTVVVFQTLPETVAEIIGESADHTVLTDALIAAGLVDALSGEGPFTVFAPTDHAFSLLPDGVLDDLMDDPNGALTDILLYHVAEIFALADDLSDGQEVTTMLGKDLVITIDDEGIFVNDAEITVFDLEADNGVVHVIDKVLIPVDDETTVNDLTGNNPLIRLYPNPANESVTLDITLIQPEKVVITVYTLTGEKAIMQDFGVLPAGSHSLTKSLGGLGRGIHIVNIETETRLENLRFLVVP